MTPDLMTEGAERVARHAQQMAAKATESGDREPVPAH